MPDVKEPIVAQQSELPAWAAELVTTYSSDAANQFILFGNVNDRLILPLGAQSEIGSLPDFLVRVLLPRFDIILTYDAGNGVRLERGGQTFSSWPTYSDGKEMPKAPRPSVEMLTHYFRYTANLTKLGKESLQVACIIRSADLLAPAVPGALNYDLNALASLIRDWSTDTLLLGHNLATFLITENLNDLHPLIVNGSRACRIKVPLPAPEDLQAGFERMAPQYPVALRNFATSLPLLGSQLSGATLGSVESLLKVKQYKNEPIQPDDVVRLKKQLVEQDSQGLIEFMDSKRKLEDFYGQEPVKRWLRQDIALWRQNEIEAMPKGYLICGPVGTGKTFLIECLAGEAGVPVVKLKNFRDKWVGSTEGNLEKVFRLLSALGRCFVFIDEADQALGKRDTGANDSGVSGRVYSMIAEEMGRQSNRGKIVWVLASSRPDLIEVDLKRPGRVDVKIPLFPTSTEEESFSLIKALCNKRGLAIDGELTKAMKSDTPLLLTPGAAEALAVKVYRIVRTENKTATDALKECLADYQNPVPPDVLKFQIELAARESTDLEFVPNVFRA